MLKEQQSLLEERNQRKCLQMEKERTEQLEEEDRQKKEDQLIVEERRKILAEHAPLLIGFLPGGVFRNLQEIDTLPTEVQEQFRRHVRIEEDPDLW